MKVHFEYSCSLYFAEQVRNHASLLKGTVLVPVNSFIMDPRELKSALKNARESIKNKEFKEALRYCKVRKFDKLFKTQQNYFNMQDN